MKPRALVPLLCVLACASGDEESSPSVGSATVPTMPNSSYDPGDSGEEPSSEPPDDSNDPATASSSAPDPSTSTFPPTTDPTLASSSSEPADTGDATSTTDPASTTVPVDTGDDCGPCDSPPGQCYANPGSCINGACDYAPTPDGSDCDDGDEYTDGDVCNGAGSCVPGPAAPCSAPHTTGGTCQNGSCVGFQCVAPYDNCDGDWENGCEVPVGIPNQCDAGGLNPNGGCWTAYCGASNDADATNFGTYHCIDCATCHEPSQGQWQWCNHTSGNWYPAEAGACGASKDLVCKP